MFRIDSVESILILIALVLALVLDLQINALGEIDLLQRTIYASMNLLFIITASTHLYRTIGEPRIYFTNLFLNAFKAGRNKTLVKLFLDTSISPSLALALYMVAIEFSIGFGEKHLVALLLPALSTLLSYIFYTTILLSLVIISKDLVLSSVATGLASLTITYFDMRLLNQIIIMEKIDFQILSSNAIVVGILFILAINVASRRWS